MKTRTVRLAIWSIVAIGLLVFQHLFLEGAWISVSAQTPEPSAAITSKATACAYLLTACRKSVDDKGMPNMAGVTACDAYLRNGCQ